MSKDDKLFDVRVSGRYIKDGLISKKEYDTFIKNLPDVEEKSEQLVIEEEVEEAGVETPESQEEGEEGNDEEANDIE